MLLLCVLPFGASKGLFSTAFCGHNCFNQQFVKGLN